MKKPLTESAKDRKKAEGMAERMRIEFGLPSEESRYLAGFARQLIRYGRKQERGKMERDAQGLVLDLGGSEMETVYVNAAATRRHATKKKT